MVLPSKTCIRFYILALALLGPFSKISGQVLVPYRADTLWGLADTTGRILVRPIYQDVDKVRFRSGNDRLLHAIPGGFFIKTNNKFGFMQRSHIIIPPVHEYLRCIDSLFIIAYCRDSVNRDSRYIAFNLRGEQVIKDTLVSLEMVPHNTDNNLLYHVKTIHGKSFLMWYDEQQQKFNQLIADNIEWIEDRDKLERPRRYFFTYKTNAGIQQADLVFNKQAGMYHVIPVTRSDRPLISWDDYLIFLVYPPIKNNFVLSNFESTVKNGKVVVAITTSRNHGGKIKEKYLSFNLTGTEAVIKKFWYRNNVDSYWYSTKPENLAEAEKIDTVLEYQNYILLKKKGKFGLICGTNIVEPIYDSIHTIECLKQNIPYFIVGKKSSVDNSLKWGVISADNKIVIPCLYDELIPKRKSIVWAVKKDSRYGAINVLTGEIELLPEYDLIKSTGEARTGFIITNSGKHGFIDDTFVCRPIFDFEINGCEEFQNYKVLLKPYRDHHQGGYADKKGFTYFKD